MDKINFLMGIHCHQPVDNLGNIFEEAYRRSYEPFLSVLERHPKIKLSLHYSGSLLDWIARERPAFLERVRALIERRQVEILSGGYFEPILPMIPAEDAKGQIAMLARSIKKRLGFDTSGVWLAERVWDPGLSSIFKDSGIKYTILDDFHLRQSGVKDTGVFGHYSVKGLDGFSVFASIRRLRYTMPFRQPEVTVNFLKELTKNPRVRCVTFADDCEKFGFWPHTYDWVYKKGWLEKFFTMLEESDWIRTMTFGEALRECEPSGEIEIPHSSYAEMAEWCGGNFNNFFKKYPESDLMRKRMLHVSRKIRDGSDEGARKELYKSQSNCAYWHGVFGGFYTNFLRQGVYRHIIKAENGLAGGNTGNTIEVIKFEDSSNEVICARNEFLALYVDPNYAGSLSEIDYKPFPYNLINTVSRRYEPYHEKLKFRGRVDIDDIKKKVDKNESVDLYEVLGVRERNLKKFLIYDSYRKLSFICHIMSLKTSLSDFIRSKHRGAASEGLFGAYDYKTENGEGNSVINLQKENGTLRLNKCIILERGADIFMKFDLENISSRRLKFIFGVEFNWSMEDIRFLRKKDRRRVRKIGLADKLSGLRVLHTFTSPVDLWSFPVYTLNESERGLGKTFQEVSLLFNRKLALKKNAKFSLEAGIRISR
ncbi:MAG: alpha-amylase/4-alpha-glucanotransferase domain-containing protein [Candidatus Omnitrophota bacterium]